MGGDKNRMNERQRVKGGEGWYQVCSKDRQTDRLGGRQDHECQTEYSNVMYRWEEMVEGKAEKEMEGVVQPNPYRLPASLWNLNIE